MEPLVFYVIQDWCRLPCQGQKSIGLKPPGKPRSAEMEDAFPREISRVRFESFLTHSAWQRKHQRRLQCELEPRGGTLGWGEWTLKTHFSRFQRLRRWKKKERGSVCLWWWTSHYSQNIPSIVVKETDFIVSYCSSLFWHEPPQKRREFHGVASHQRKEK